MTIAQHLNFHLWTESILVAPPWGTFDDEFYDPAEPAATRDVPPDARESLTPLPFGRTAPATSNEGASK